MKSILEKIKAWLIKTGEKNPYYLLGIALFALLVVDYTLIMHWQLRTLRIVNPKLTTLSQDIQTAHDNIQRRVQYQNNIQELQGEAVELQQSIILREEFPSVLDNISRLAKRFGIKIDQVRPLTEQQEEVLKNNDGKYFSVPISINARGGYHDIGRFLSQLETQDTFFNVAQIDFTAGVDNTSRHSAEITMIVIILEKA